jgi:beta-ketoacyl-acyl-carrier-protein synthase II
MRRAVITGLGALTPLGNNVDEFWKNCKDGKSGAGPITRFDAANFKTRFACEIKDYNPEQYFDRKEVRKIDAFCQYALIAADEAVKDSGLDVTTINPLRAGVIWGSGYGGVLSMQEQVIDYGVHGRQPRFTPFFITRMIINMGAGFISIKYGFKGINYAPVAACATSNVAILESLNQIRFGKADIIIAGGSEAAIAEAGIGGFNGSMALSTNNDQALTACRPFDVTRDGFVMGEGAGALIIEELEHAKKRGAKIYAEIIGGAMTADSYHITASHPDGEGAINAMELALQDSGISTSEVDYINAHATSTPLGDVSETKAIATVFGDDVRNLNISATKSMTGHLLGAAGAIEAIVCIKSINDSVIPPTINTQTVDPEIPGVLNLTFGKAQERNVNIAMSNTFGFGGHNVITVFKKYNG